MGLGVAAIATDHKPVASRKCSSRRLARPHPAPSPKTAAAPAVPIIPDAALIEPIPVPVPKTAATASKSADMPLTTATPVVPHRSEAGAPDTKRFFAAQRALTHAGWIIQVGAFDIERERSASQVEADRSAFDQGSSFWFERVPEVADEVEKNARRSWSW
jgi:hypothetical protein